MCVLNSYKEVEDIVWSPRWERFLRPTGPLLRSSSEDAVVHFRKRSAFVWQVHPLCHNVCCGSFSYCLVSLSLRRSILLRKIRSRRNDRRRRRRRLPSPSSTFFSSSFSALRLSRFFLPSLLLLIYLTPRVRVCLSVYFLRCLYLTPESISRRRTPRGRILY